MKYLKTYEKKEKPKYKIGDYVLVYSEFEELFNVIMKIDDFYYDQDENDLLYSCEYISGYNPSNFPGCELPQKDIIRKLEQHEIDALKYNL